jgi:histidyl-tRNA synthetase
MKLQSIRGMNDIVPPHSSRWQQVEKLLADILRSYGYRQIRLPIMENTAVFERSIGDVTDIVQKEMYTFADRNGDSLSLRPEGTAGCVRAVLENGLIQQGLRKLWYIGPMFRHERPQKGRYRQFHQIGVEVFDLAGPDIDAELILMTARMWQALGLTDLRLELNTLGTVANRKAYRSVLFDYFSASKDQLDEDSLNRLERNPMRILDSKNPALRPLIDNAPQLIEHLDNMSREHFERLGSILNTAGIEFQINPLLVRGLDYYSNTVFEWITDSLGAQGTVCAGGRYDGLVETLGGRPTPAIGFAMGLERLIELVQMDRNDDIDDDADIYLVSTDDAYVSEILVLAEQVRRAGPQWRVVCHCGGGSIKSQMKKADRSGAQVALIIGENESQNKAVTIKPLRNQAEQVTVAYDLAIDRARSFLVPGAEREDVTL